MLRLRLSAARGYADLGWLQTHHTFSFAHYQDPAYMQCRALRVINEDRIAPGRGFGRHPHRDMEILTLVVSGALRHEDSMGHGSTILPFEVQRMCAGTGVTHSEPNASSTEPVHLLQIWLLPNRLGVAPAYNQKHFAQGAPKAPWVCLASPDGRTGSIQINADASLARGQLAPKSAYTLPIAPGQTLWVQVIAGAITLDGTALGSGDGACVTAQTQTHIKSQQHSDVLVFGLR